MFVFQGKIKSHLVPTVAQNEGNNTHFQ